MRSLKHYSEVFRNRRVVYIAPPHQNVDPDFPFPFNTTKLRERNERTLPELVGEYDIYIIPQILLDSSHFNQFYDNIAGSDRSLYVTYRDKSLIPLTGPDGGFSKNNHLRLKRVLDVVLASFLLLSLFPILLLIALAIRLESKGRVIYTQERAASLFSKPFKMYKFRTMRVDSDGLKYNQYNPKSLLFKVENDSRVTRLGRFLRRYDLDEIPQFINVIKGEMSLVGPRPLPVRDLEIYRENHNDYWLKVRSLAKPGITGLWQTNGRNGTDHFNMAFYDYQYIENLSLRTDVAVLFRTIGAVLKDMGNY